MGQEQCSRLSHGTLGVADLVLMEISVLWSEGDSSPVHPCALLSAQEQPAETSRGSGDLSPERWLLDSGPGSAEIAGVQLGAVGQGGASVMVSASCEWVVSEASVRGH